MILVIFNIFYLAMSSSAKNCARKYSKHNDYRDQKISTEDINFIVKQRDVNFELTNVVAILDMANIVYDKTDLPKDKRTKIIFEEKDANEFISKTIDVLTSYIISLPDEVEKVIIFATKCDNDFYKLKPNKQLIPFNFTKEQLETLGFENRSGENTEGLYYDNNVKQGEYPVTCKPLQKLTPFNSLPTEKQNELNGIYSKYIEMIKLSKNKTTTSYTDNYARKSFINYIDIPTILNIFY